MPTIHDLNAQAQWEMEGTRRAAVRYQEAADVSDPTTLAAGKALLRGVLKPLIAAIIARRDEISASLASPGRQPEWAWPVQVIDPEKTAVITLLTCVRAGMENETAATRGGVWPIPTCAKHIAECVRDQLQYDRWEAEQIKRNKEAKVAGTEGHKDRLKALKLTYPNLDRRVWAKWSAKMEVAALADWDEKTAVSFGAMLVRLLVDVAPDRFEIKERKVAQGVQYVLRIAPSVLEVMNDVRERAEVSRPMLMPMICPPVPWTYDPAPLAA